MNNNHKSVLFICLGNTCRSPIAEAVFRNLVKAKGLENEWKVDSAALKPWHVGSQPNHRSLSVLKANGICYTHTARHITEDDFRTHDSILGMDTQNIQSLRQMAPQGCRAKISLLGAYDFSEKDQVIWDPYCDDSDEGFVKCYKQCVRFCEAFLAQESQANYNEKKYLQAAIDS